MKFKIVKLNQFSGNKAGIYSVALNNDNETLFNKFVRENIISFKSETKDILKRLFSIRLYMQSHKTQTVHIVQI